MSYTGQTHGSYSGTTSSTYSDGRHKLTPEEGRRGARASKKKAKFARQMEALSARLKDKQIDAEQLGKFTDILKVAIVNPYVGGVVAYLIADYVYDETYGFSPFKESPVDGDHIKGAIIAGMTANAVGGALAAAGSIVGALAG